MNCPWQEMKVLILSAISFILLKHFFYSFWTNIHTQLLPLRDDSHSEPISLQNLATRNANILFPELCMFDFEKYLSPWELQLI